MAEPSPEAPGGGPWPVVPNGGLGVFGAWAPYDKLASSLSRLQYPWYFPNFRARRGLEPELPSDAPEALQQACARACLTPAGPFGHLPQSGYAAHYYPRRTSMPVEGATEERPGWTRAEVVAPPWQVEHAIREETASDAYGALLRSGQLLAARRAFYAEGPAPYAQIARTRDRGRAQFVAVVGGAMTLGFLRGWRDRPTIVMGGITALLAALPGAALGWVTKYWLCDRFVDRYETEYVFARWANQTGFTAYARHLPLLDPSNPSSGPAVPHEVLAEAGVVSGLGGEAGLPAADAPSQRAFSTSAWAALCRARAAEQRSEITAQLVPRWLEPHWRTRQHAAVWEKAVRADVDGHCQQVGVNPLGIPQTAPAGLPGPLGRLWLWATDQTIGPSLDVLASCATPTLAQDSTIPDAAYQAHRDAIVQYLDRVQDTRIRAAETITNDPSITPGRLQTHYVVDPNAGLDPAPKALDPAVEG